MAHGGLTVKLNGNALGLRLAVSLAVLITTHVGTMPARGQLAHVLPPVETQPATTQPASVARPAIVEFQPGVRINWGRRKVEVDGVVVLREGLLELFACSPNTREHESIVRVDARPLHIYQALGLIGLEPGHPIRLNPETKQIEPARGGPVEIEVRYEINGQTRQHPIERWMRTAGEGRPLNPQPWVFAGSAPTPEGNFMADAEGTVIAVVDFACALIALPERYSDRNDELWLEPATEAIPERWTECTLIFRQGPLRLTLDASGRLLLESATITPGRLSQVLRQGMAHDRELRVRVTVEPGCPVSAERMLRDLLRDLEVPEEAISTSRPAASAPPEQDAQAMAQWLRQHLVPASQTDGDSRQARASQPRYLAEDLRERSLALSARTQAIAEYAAQLAGNLERFFLFSDVPQTEPADDDGD
jgi:hypothetical protein